ncbi:DUF502 domain-containing protein [Candidatus Woesearchaeota archaeon]|nr:DUF502 domain-containing protein [Candidatus Woesearchaeota archaeon]
MRQSLARFFDYFLIGVLGALPIFIIIQIVIYLSSFLLGFVMGLWGRYENALIPIVAFIAATFVLMYFGFLLKQEKAHLLYFFEKLIDRIPLLGSIYRVTKKILGLFRGDEEQRLRDVVFVEYPRAGLWVPAYVTNRVDDHLVLFVPTSPNPTSGFTLIVHESQTRVSQMTIEEVSSFIISLGVDFPRAEEVKALRSLDRP